MQPRPMSESRAVLTDMIFPPNSNHFHAAFGGHLLSLMDRITCISAMRHSRHAVQTVAVDRVNFTAPVAVGHAIILKSVVVHVGRTSMHIYVTAADENLHESIITPAASAFFTFVALDDQGRPTAVPGLIVETAEDLADLQIWDIMNNNNSSRHDK